MPLKTNQSLLKALKKKSNQVTINKALLNRRAFVLTKNMNRSIVKNLVMLFKIY